MNKSFIQAFIWFLVSAVGYCAPHYSLLEWSVLCNGLLHEYDGPSRFADPLSTVLASDVLRSTIAQFRQVTKNQLTEWCSDMPSAAWFENDSFVDLDCPFVQKLHVRDGAQICFIGDLHGSVHSLIRNLESLERMDLLSEDFSLAPNMYLVLLGDFTDSGRYGIEVWYTMMQLKIVNPDRVFLVRGNHELRSSASAFGFLNGEKRQKAHILDPNLFEQVVQLFHLVPCALFIEAAGRWIQCCHGGISPDYTEELFVALKEHTASITCQQVRDNIATDFQWSDFSQRSTGGMARPNPRRGAGRIADRRCVRRYLDERDLVCIFRGHQDLYYGCKIMHMYDNLVPHQYLPHWREAVPDAGDHIVFPSNANLFPVVTLSSAPEGRRLGQDCYVILVTGRNLEDWSLVIEEQFVNPERTKVKKCLNKYGTNDYQDYQAGSNKPSRVS